MMQREQEHTLPWLQPYQPRPQQRTGGQIERTLRFDGGNSREFPRLRGAIERLEIGDVQPDAHLRVDVQPRFAREDDDAAAQDVVAVGNRLEALLQRGGGDVRVERERDVDVIRRTARREQLEEPHPLLRERQRHRAGARGQPRNRQTAWLEPFLLQQTPEQMLPFGRQFRHALAQRVGEAVLGAHGFNRSDGRAWAASSARISSSDRRSTRSSTRTILAASDSARA